MSRGRSTCASRCISGCMRRADCRECTVYLNAWKQKSIEACRRQNAECECPASESVSVRQWGERTGYRSKRRALSAHSHLSFSSRAKSIHSRCILVSKRKAAAFFGSSIASCKRRRRGLREVNDRVSASCMKCECGEMRDARHEARGRQPVGQSPET